MSVRGKRQSLPTGQQVMLDHVKELRIRLFVCAGVLILGGVLGYLFYEQILVWLKSPLVGDLYYTTPAGSFNFILKVSTMVGIAMVIPLAVYQLIMFTSPALKKAFSRSRVIGYTGISVLLAAAGAAFGFYIILPGALHFFAGFQVSGLSALISADSYLSFVTNVLITFIIVFQIPLILVIIDHINPIPPKRLFNAEKYVILGGLVVSFFVPFALDITTSLLIAAPIIVLYNISIGVIIWRHYLLRPKTVGEVRRAQDIEVDDELVAAIKNQQNNAPIFDEPILSSILDSEYVPVPAPVVSPTVTTLRGAAMEFQRNRQQSMQELREAIERDRAQAIANKVSQYNKNAGMRRISGIQ